jgi:hypothetical protein
MLDGMAGIPLISHMPVWARVVSAIVVVLAVVLVSTAVFNAVGASGGHGNTRPGGGHGSQQTTTPGTGHGGAGHEMPSGGAHHN